MVADRVSGFEELTGTIVPLGKDDVDTDQVIPARFLKGTVKTGLGENLFFDWRYDDAGKPKPDFALNLSQYKEGTILIARRNFGCGSSREHAVWALTDYGFRAVIAISFADIFRNNALKNGLLPIVLSPPLVERLLSTAIQNPDFQVTIDLPSQQVTLLGTTHPFDIDPFRKKCLLEGLDDIGYTLQHEAAISRYEATGGSFP